ncbi:MAG: conjugative transposon protein TraN [Chitinophagaceae bacterium]
MKQFVSMVSLCLLFVSVSAQTPLGITTDKTTSLVFPFAIKHVDRGTESVLAQQVKEAPTILLVKAAEKDFTETNLSVVTDDGSVYSFTVCYDVHPAVMVHYLPIKNKATTAMYANAILDNKKSVKKINDHKWKTDAEVIGIYVKNDVMFYHVRLKNNSPIDYNIDFIRFYIRDKKKSKRTAIQDIDLKPLHTVGNITNIKSNTTSTMVFALEKFTIPDAKYMALQINEKNGGRHFSIRVKNKKIMNAIVLPDYK